MLTKFWRMYIFIQCYISKSCVWIQICLIHFLLIPFWSFCHHFLFETADLIKFYDVYLKTYFGKQAWLGHAKTTSHPYAVGRKVNTFVKPTLDCSAFITPLMEPTQNLTFLLGHLPAPENPYCTQNDRSKYIKNFNTKS